MFDASYDAVIIGGGNKALITALYLQKYGQMKTAVFEIKHEIGGCMAGDESAVPGFVHDQHATDIGDFWFSILEDDFPINERGYEWVPYIVPGGGIYEEDGANYIISSPFTDPEQKLTYASFAKFSKRDADTWLALWDMWANKGGCDAFMKYLHNPPPADPNEPDIFETFLMTSPEFRAMGFDRSWFLRTAIQVMSDLFESDHLITGLIRIAHSWNSVPSDIVGGGLFTLFTLLGLTRFGGAKGGTHSIAHAIYKCFIEDGGKTFTEHEVKRVIIENGKARGVELSDGTRIEAKKLVVSGLGPHALVHDLTGEQYWPWRVLRRIKNLSYWYAGGIAWATWCTHEPPDYLAAKTNPELADVGWLTLGSADPWSMPLSHYYKRLGLQCPDMDMVICNHVSGDKTRVPDGKWSFLAEDYSAAPPICLYEHSDKWWRDYKKAHIERQLQHIQKFATNMTWDNVIGVTMHTEYDVTRMLGSLYKGCWSGVDQNPTQVGRNRPIPELARHKTTIEGLYATGVAWHYGGMGSASQGYNCYKIIAEDFGLPMPPKSKDRGY